MGWFIIVLTTKKIKKGDVPATVDYREKKLRIHLRFRGYHNPFVENCLYDFPEKIPVVKCLPYFLVLFPSKPAFSSINQH